MNNLKVKVCGMRDERNVREIADLHPDFMGFIYYPPSPRHFGDMPADVVRGLPEDTLPVLVSVDMSESDMLGLIAKYNFRGVQLHGNESPELCATLHNLGLYVIKAVSVRDHESLHSASLYSGVADMLVFDTASAAKGGSGKKFDWGLISDSEIATDFLLSGGINPEDAPIIREFNHPRFKGVDINSRFETSPGIKDPWKVTQFIRYIKEI